MGISDISYDIIDKTLENEDRKYIPVGNFLLKVLTTSEATNPNSGKEFFCVEFEVMESDNDEIAAGDKLSHVIQTNAIGLKFPTLKERNERELTKLMAKMLKAAGVEFEDARDMVSKFLKGPDSDEYPNPAEGAIISCRGYIGERSKTGFVKTTFDTP